MERITHWLNPAKEYFAKQNGHFTTKSNLKFLSEVKAQLLKDPERVAEIRSNIAGEMAVVTGIKPRLV